MTAWEQFWSSISILDVALAVIAVSLVVGFLVKGWPKLRAGIRLIDTLGTLPDRLDTIDKRLDEIHHETHKNDGSSIKDAVDRIEVTVEQQGDLLAAALMSDEQQSAALDTLNSRFDDYEDTFTKETP